MKSAKSIKPGKAQTKTAKAKRSVQAERNGNEEPRPEPLLESDPLAPIPQWVFDEFKNVTFLPPVSKRTKAANDIRKSIIEVIEEDGW